VILVPLRFIAVNQRMSHLVRVPLETVMTKPLMIPLVNSCAITYDRAVELIDTYGDIDWHRGVDVIFVKLVSSAGRRNLFFRLVMPGRKLLA
jgi:hypothetical protein